MLLQTTLLATIAALFPSAALAQQQEFSGPGHLRTLSIGRTNPDLGCLTVDGKWTTNESACGTFDGTWYSADNADSGTFTLSTAAGACGLANGIDFTCGPGVEAKTFEIWGTGDQSPVKGREILRAEQYGIFASDGAAGPPTPDQAPLSIHLYSGSEQGKYVWLGWNSTQA